MNYPIFGRRVEVIKNCTILQHCWFTRGLLCDDPYGLISNCSIQCCKGDLCNNRTVQIAPSSVTRVVTHTSAVKRTNITRVVTRATMTTMATRAPRLISGIHVTSSVSSTQSFTPNDKTVTSWTSQRSQVAIFSSKITTNESSFGVKAVSSHAKRFLSQLSILMSIIASGII